MRCSSLTTLISLRCKVVKPRHTSVDRPESRRECFCFLSETLEQVSQVLGQLLKELSENVEFSINSNPRSKGNAFQFSAQMPKNNQKFATTELVRTSVPLLPQFVLLVIEYVQPWRAECERQRWRFIRPIVTYAPLTAEERVVGQLVRASRAAFPRVIIVIIGEYLCR